MKTSLKNLKPVIKLKLFFIKHQIQSVKKKVLRILLFQQGYQKIDKLFKLLNLRDISIKDKNLSNLSLKISEYEIQKYVKLSTYKLIDIHHIKKSDYSTLDKIGINPELLKINSRIIDEAGIVEKLNFSETENSYYHNLLKYKNFPVLDKTVKTLELELKKLKNYPIYLKKNCIEKEYIYAICPSTGQILASNYSFFMGYNCFYKFVGEKTFYLVLSSNYSIDLKFFIYYPNEELIIKINDNFDRLYLFHALQIVDEFKLYFLLFRNDILKYINNNKKQKVLWIDNVVIGKKSQLGHYLINTLSALETLKESIIKASNAKIVAMRPLYYGKIEDIFPEFSDKEIEVIESVKNNKELFHFALSNNYYIVRIRQFEYVTENTSLRVYESCKKQCSRDFLEHIKQIRNKHSLLMLITLRTGRRQWISQIEGIINIVNNLTESYPDLGVVIDGYSIIQGEENTQEIEQAIEREKQVIEKIISSVKTTVNIYDSVGCTVPESVIYGNIIDFYFAPYGSGMIKYFYIGNKPGVIHEPVHLKEDTKQINYSAEEQTTLWRENAKMPLVIAKQFIHSNNSSNRLNTDYDFDWRIAYKEIVKLISLLQTNNLNQQ